MLKILCKFSVDEDEEPDVVDDEGAEGAEEDVKPGKSTKKTVVDPELAFQKLGDVKKFNYLLGMSMWMLTEERKNELLKQRDQKLAELKILRSKTPNHLWLEDLDELSKKLDEVEQAERLEEAGMNKKKKTVKKETTAFGKMRNASTKKRGGARDETKPSDDGMEIEYKVTEDMLKKFEKADAAKGAGRVKKEKVVKTEGGTTTATPGEGEEFDEFDALVEAGEKPVVKTEKPKAAPKPRAKKEPKSKDGLKQPKLDFGKKKGVSKVCNKISIKRRY